MRLVIQRVTQASVDVEGREVARIGSGVVVFVGFTAQDTTVQFPRAAEAIIRLRMFDNAAGALDRSLADVNGELLVVPEITLAALLAKGKRPSFDGAAPAATARALFEAFVQALRAVWPRVAAGEFQTHMHVSLVNDGPVTFVIDELH